MAAYMVLIFVLSGMSSPPTPAGWNDKVEHLFGYGVLGLVTLRATAGGVLSGVTGGAAVAAWVIATAYGVTDEYHQSFVAGRSPDSADVMADALGALAIIAPVWAFGIIARSRHSTGAASRRR